MDNPKEKRRQTAIDFDWKVTKENKDIFPKQVAEFLSKEFDMQVYYKTCYIVRSEDWFKAIDEYNDNVLYATSDFYVKITNYFSGGFLSSEVKKVLEESVYGDQILQFPFMHT